MLEYNKQKINESRLAILRAIAEATRRGQCAIIGVETKNGTRIVVLGKSIVQSQADEIVKKADF